MRSYDVHSQYTVYRNDILCFLFKQDNAKIDINLMPQISRNIGKFIIKSQL